MCEFLGSTRLEPTVIGGEVWIACEGTGVSVGVHFLFFLQCGPRSPQRVYNFFRRKLGHVLDGQPIVIL